MRQRQASSRVVKSPNREKLHVDVQVVCYSGAEVCITRLQYSYGALGHLQPIREWLVR